MVYDRVPFISAENQTLAAPEEQRKRNRAAGEPSERAHPSTSPTQPKKGLAKLEQLARKSNIDVENLKKPEDLIKNARKIARCIKLPSQHVLDYLYANSRCGPMPQADWEGEIRVALAIVTILKGTLQNTRFEAFETLFDREAMKELAGQLVSSSGTLALTFHGGFPIFTCKAFARLFRDGIIVARGGEYSAEKDSSFALFAARRALLDGRSVLMAPDGRSGKRPGTINAVGAACAIGDGAAFLAHDTKCATAWLQVVRTDDGFAAVYVPGPRHAGGESFGQFRDRLYGFFAERVENALTGEPRNLFLSEGWVGIFETLLAAKH